MKETLRDLIHVPFRFEYSGSQIIYYNQEEDFSEITRDRDGRTAYQFKELDDLRGGR